jgi:hypothetical protein
VNPGASPSFKAIDHGPSKPSRRCHLDTDGSRNDHAAIGVGEGGGGVGLEDDPSDRAERGWVSEPEHSDAVIGANTGRGWEQWCELIDAWPGHRAGHTAVATWLQEEHDVDGWWAQAVTGGWERISGRRLPYQMEDGTFTANKSATITTDHDALRELLLGEEGRADLFPGLTPVLRSRRASKNVRIALVQGVAEISLSPKDDGRVTVTVAHTKLGSPDEVEQWKRFWSEWFVALGE